MGLSEPLKAHEALPSQQLVAYSLCLQRLRKHWREKTVEREVLIEMFC